MCKNGDKHFITSSDTNSCTIETNFLNAEWRFSCGKFMLIDTPGFADTSRTDNEISSLMVVRLAQLEFVNSILIVLNG